MYKMGIPLTAPLVVSSVEEIRDWRLETSTLPPPVSSLKSPVSNLVGREAELTQLQRCLDKTLADQRQMVFIAGESEIGKTSLVEAFLARLASRHEHGLWIGRGQCIEQYGSGEAYLPLLEALGRLGRALGGTEVVAVLEQYAPTWLAQLPSLTTKEKRAVLQCRLLGHHLRQTIRTGIYCSYTPDPRSPISWQT